MSVGLQPYKTGYLEQQSKPGVCESVSVREAIILLNEVMSGSPRIENVIFLFCKKTRPAPQISILNIIEQSKLAILDIL